MDLTLVDVSAWIEAFRPRGDPKITEVVRERLAADQILMPDLIKVELLRGTKTNAEFERLKELLEALAPLPIEEAFWDDLSSFGFQPLRKGLTAPLVYAAIALLAIQQDVPLLRRDRHFDLIAKKSDLKILNFD
ncbi:MAG: PIN domain-containing protein [Thermodesulfobacteriota bacterium]